jgi:hypothetical protein
MAKDKKLLTEGQMNRWAKLANIKSSLKAGVLTEARRSVNEGTPPEEQPDPPGSTVGVGDTAEEARQNRLAKEKKKKEQEHASKPKPKTESVVKEDLDDLEDLEDLGDEDLGDEDLGDEAPEEDMPVDEGTVEELVSAIAGAIQDVTGVEVNVEGDAEEGLDDMDMDDDFGPADDEDLGDDDELMEGDGGEVKYTGQKGGASHYEGPETVIEPQKVTRSKEGVYSPDKPTEITGRAKPKTEGLVQEQIEAVRSYIISEVANRVRVRAQHEAQKQHLAESLADKIFAKLRNKKG